MLKLTYTYYMINKTGVYKIANKVNGKYIMAAQLHHLEKDGALTKTHYYNQVITTHISKCLE